MQLPPNARIYVCTGYTDRRGHFHRGNVWVAEFDSTGHYVHGSLKLWHWIGHDGKEIPEGDNTEPSLSALFKGL